MSEFLFIVFVFLISTIIAVPLLWIVQEFWQALDMQRRLSNAIDFRKKSKTPRI